MDGGMDRCGQNSGAPVDLVLDNAQLEILARGKAHGAPTEQALQEHGCGQSSGCYLLAWSSTMPSLRYLPKEPQKSS